MFDLLTHQQHKMPSTISPTNKMSMQQNVSSAAFEIAILRVTCNKELINELYGCDLPRIVIGQAVVSR